MPIFGKRRPGENGIFYINISRKARKENNMKIIKLTLALCLIIAFVAIQGNEANAQCKNKYSIDYVVTWSPYFDACNSEMKTTVEYLIEYPGAYKSLLCEVDNTPFSIEYWAGDLCPEDPPCSGTVTDWMHLTNRENLRMHMDIRPIIGEYLGFNEHVFAVEFFADQPD